MTKSDLTAKGYLLFGFLSLALLLGTFGFWSVTAKLASAIVVDGVVRTSQYHQLVQHPEGGSVVSLNVKNGSIVSAGDTLLQFDPMALNSQLEILDAQYFEILARVSRTIAEIDGTDTITFPEELIVAANTNPALQKTRNSQTELLVARNHALLTQFQQLDKRRAQITEQSKGLIAQEQSLKSQLSLLSEMLERTGSLHKKGLSVFTQLQALRKDEATLLGALGEVHAKMSEADLKVTETELEKVRLHNSHRESIISELSDQQATLSNLKAKRHAVSTQLNRTIVRAPISGIVHDLKLHSSQTVAQPGQILLQIIPQNQSIQISTRIASGDIDHISPNQLVTITFPTFDAENFPELTGTVRNISADTFQDEQTGLHYYEVEVEISNSELARRPKGTILLPGTPVTAYFRTGDRTPLQYLIQPFRVFFDKALRET